MELCEELGISEADIGGKVTFEGKDPFVRPLLPDRGQLHPEHREQSRRQVAEVVF